MINKFAVKDLNGALRSTTGEYAFFPRWHFTFMKTDDELGHKANIQSQQISKNQYHKTASQLS